MAKAKSSPVVSEESHAAALQFALKNPGPQKLSSFPSKPATAALLNASPPLLMETNAGRLKYAELTTRGVREAVLVLPETERDSLLWAYYLRVPKPDRDGFLDELGSLRRGIDARILAEEAASAEAERETYRTKYRTELDRHRAKRELAEETAGFHARLEAEFDGLLRKMAESAPKVKRIEPKREEVVEKFAEVKEADRDFRKAVVREMARAWFDLAKRGEADTAYDLECLLRKIPDVERIGEAGETVEFAPDIHEADNYIDKGTSVTIQFPGWQIRDRVHDAVSVILRAFVD